MNLVENLPSEVRQKVQLKTQPTWVSPMLATLTDERFSRENWVFERKLDGERCLAFKRGNKVQLQSRNHKSIGDMYPEIVDAVVKQKPSNIIVDGEIVAFDGEVTSFQLLQNRIQVHHPSAILQKSTPVFYYLFDLLYLDGYDITRIGLVIRKQLLLHSLSFFDPLRFTTHIDREGEAYYGEACKKGWEGIIAKKADSIYESARSKDWLKFKCMNR